MKYTVDICIMEKELRFIIVSAVHASVPNDNEILFSCVHAILHTFFFFFVNKFVHNYFRHCFIFVK